MNWLSRLKWEAANIEVLIMNDKTLTTSTGIPVGDDQNTITAGERGPVLIQDFQRGVAIFAKACFGHPSPSKRQKLNATANAFGTPDDLPDVIPDPLQILSGAPHDGYPELPTPTDY